MVEDLFKSYTSRSFNQCNLYGKCELKVVADVYDKDYRPADIHVFNVNVYDGDLNVYNYSSRICPGTVMHFVFYAPDFLLLSKFVFSIPWIDQ